MRPILNLCEAPYHADPTGARDCTESICRALDDLTAIVLSAFRQGLAETEALPATGLHYHPDGVENRRENGVVCCGLPARLPFVPVLYLPAGTFLVSDTLRYRCRDLSNTYGNELNMQLRIRGAGVDRTVLTLRDRSPGFEAGAAKPVLSLMRAQTSNVAMSNYCEDLTIHCGSGNPGAVGLDFFANNSGAARNLRIVSGDGRGFAGIRLGHGNYSGILIKHVAVDGFDHGLHIDSDSATMFAHAEAVCCRNQRVAAITVGAISLSLRRLQTEDVPVALSCVDSRGHTVLVDSALSGRGASAIVRRAGSLYAADVDVAGFDDAGTIARRVHPPCPLPTGGDAMARLPIEETPVYVPSGSSIGVRAFGAIGNGVNDDSASFQAAVDSGAAWIVVEPGRYRLDAPVTIPVTVACIDFSFSDLVAGADLGGSDREGFVIVGDAGAQPLFMERLFAWEQWRGDHCTVTHAGARTVCFKDMHTQTLRFYRNSVPGGKVFFDNVATTTGAIPGVHGHGRCAIALTGQKAWARQLNPERGEPMILNDGGDLVLMGYKSEGKGVVVRTINGGRSEVLGGVINIGDTGDAAFVTDRASHRISTASQGWRPPAFHRSAVRILDGERRTEVPSAAMPSRHFPVDRGPQYVIPLHTTAPRTTDA